MKCSILDENDIKKQGLGLLMAVGQGSPYPPRLVIIEYRGTRNPRKPSPLLVKAVPLIWADKTSNPRGPLKPCGRTAGAAAVVGAMKALARLKPKVNVVGICALAHNAIGRDGFFPGDVYGSYSGKTVEINSTDAEGRLVLADAIRIVKHNSGPFALSTSQRLPAA